MDCHANCIVNSTASDENSMFKAGLSVPCKDFDRTRDYASTPSELPTHIWPTYTLWQYSDGKSGPSPRAVNGKGFERDSDVGTLYQLLQKWPF
jgi:hypothetical protein